VNFEFCLYFCNFVLKYFDPLTKHTSVAFYKSGAKKKKKETTLKECRLCFSVGVADGDMVLLAPVSFPTT